MNGKIITVITVEILKIFKDAEISFWNFVEFACSYGKKTKNVFLVLPL